MPLLDIAHAQPSLQSPLVSVRTQTLIHGQRLSNPWKSSTLPKRVNFHVGQLENLSARLQIRAVVTLEPKCSVSKEDEHTKSQLGVGSTPSTQLESFKPGDSDEELDEREKLRRRRISKANKGNTPWNKGRKHSAETLQRIRERTRLAMQNPKVRMKLANLGHAQSQETREKIATGVRMGWERRREKLLVQETCHFEWMNLIAEASRKGYLGEEELQWDSYKILDEQLTKEWQESVEQRKTMPRPKGSKRAPKSPEQRRKIAEAISAKWSDPEYRERVCSALAKYHGISEGALRKPKRKSAACTQSKQSPSKSKANETSYSSTSETIIPIERLRLRRKNKPLYKDPMASSKLEMLKNIRAQRATEEMKKTEAVERARLLIAEAEKAAKALEVAAGKSPIARASLIETRKLIAEAIQSIESIEGGRVTYNENSGYIAVASDEPVSPVEKTMQVENSSLSQADQKEVNGNQFLSLSEKKDLSFPNFMLPRIVNGDGDGDELTYPSSSNYSIPNLNLDNLIKKSDSPKQLNQLETNRIMNGTKAQVKNNSMAAAVTKKWVHGRSSSELPEYIEQCITCESPTTLMNRLRLLIAEAEKAAKALEVAAGKSPIARASHIKTRKLIAETIQSIESIEGGRVTYDENGGYIAVASEKTMQSENSSLSQADQKEVNGKQFLSLSEKKDLGFPNGDGDEVTHPSSSNYSIPNLNLDDLIKKSDSPKQLNQLETNRIMNGTKAQVKNNSMAAAVTKKWIHGRLVEVAEGAS
ncbi:hypothetical protein GQ457_07G030690 [Hibiscus cannabinus]